MSYSDCNGDVTITVTDTVTVTVAVDGIKYTYILTDSGLDITVPVSSSADDTESLLEAVIPPYPHQKHQTNRMR
jgi:hypothetical protein